MQHSQGLGLRAWGPVEVAGTVRNCSIMPGPATGDQPIAVPNR